MSNPPRSRSHRAARARAHLPEHDPALASLVIWCDLVDAAGEETFTSGDTLHIGAGFERLPLREQIGVLGHHVLHIALRHEYRMQAFSARFGSSCNPHLHNLCSDAILNECLTRAGLAIPPARRTT